MEGIFPVRKLVMIFVISFQEIFFIMLINYISVVVEKAPLWCEERRKTTMRNDFVLISLENFPTAVDKDESDSDRNSYAPVMGVQIGTIILENKLQRHRAFHQQFCSWVYALEKLLHM